MPKVGKNQNLAKSSCRTRSGIQKRLNLLDSSFHRNDGKGPFAASYDFIKLGVSQNCYSISQREMICLFPLFMNPTMAPGLNVYKETLLLSGVLNSAWGANL